jgi:hypothetical protein
MYCSHGLSRRNYRIATQRLKSDTLPNKKHQNNQQGIKTRIKISKTKPTPKEEKLLTSTPTSHPRAEQPQQTNPRNKSRPQKQ